MDSRLDYEAMKQWKRRTLWFFCISLLCSSILIHPAYRSYGQDVTKKQVLVLNSYHRGYKWTDDITEGILSVFGPEKENVSLYIEYMDSKRVSDEQYFESLREIYKHKFRNVRFDVIICSDDNAFNFLLKHRNEIFPDTPVVFCGVNYFNESDLEGHDLFTGVNEEANLKAGIDLALKLHPDTEQVVVITDTTTTGKKIHTELMEIIPAYPDTIEFILFEDMEMKEIQERIQGLPSDSLVFYTFFFRDKSGKFFEYDESISLIAEKCAVPIYGAWDLSLGHGVVGGMLTSGYHQGEAAAKTALRILQGERVKDIPIIKESPNRYMFDYHQLDRFGIKLSKLPEGSIVINKPRSLYAERKGLVWTVIASVGGLSLVVFALSLSVLKRKQAEEKLKEAHDKLEQHVAERTRDLHEMNQQLNLELSQRMKTEDALRQSERYYRTLLVSLHEDILVIGRDYLITDINDGYLVKTRFKREEVIGRPCFLISHAYHEPCHRFGEDCRLIEVFKTGDPQTCRHVHTRSDGDKIWMDIIMSPLRDENGNVTHVIEAARDVTHLIEIEKALQESEVQYRTLFESSQEAIFLMKGEGIVECNPATESLFKCGREELLGSSIFRFSPEAQPDGKSSKEKGAEYVRLAISGIPQRFEWVHHTCQGDPLDVDVSLSRIRIEEESHLLVLERDIGEEKRLQKQLQQAQKMEAIGTLAGGIAHDFNNLLMGIVGNAALMLLDMGSKHLHYEKLKNIEQYVQNGAELTRQFLGFARGGKYEVKPTVLNDLIENSSRMFGRTKKEIMIHRKYQKGIWPVEVDSGQIEQVLLNLYVNAWQAMPEGGELYLETVNVELDEYDVKAYGLKPGNYVRVSVTDTGMGMDMATQQRIFEPFFTTKEMGRGTGLGLASAYGIVKNHGGIINVESKKGEGTTFNIYLRASARKVTKKEAKPQEILRGSETILLVDDENMIIDVGKQILKKLGYRVFTATSGREAIEVYEKNKTGFDMVILDIIMPDMGGGLVYDRMKEINPNVRVLLSSGYSIHGQAKEILERGCDGFVQKPFNTKNLSQKLREILDKESA